MTPFLVAALLVALASPALALHTPGHTYDSPSPDLTTPHPLGMGFCYCPPRKGSPVRCFMQTKPQTGGNGAEILCQCTYDQDVPFNFFALGFDTCATTAPCHVLRFFGSVLSPSCIVQKHLNGTDNPCTSQCFYPESGVTPAQ